MAIIRALDIGPVALPGTGYPPLAAFDIPVRAGLTGAFFLGDGADIAVTNWAGGSDAIVVGAPGWRSGYADLGAGNYLQTDIAETAAMTMLAVMRRDGTGENVGFLGNWSPSTGGAAMLVQSALGGSTLRQAASRTDTNASTSQTSSGSIDQWTLGVLTLPATGAGELRNETAGVSVATGSTNRQVGTSGPMKIGAIGVSTDLPRAFSSICD